MKILNTAPAQGVEPLSDKKRRLVANEWFDRLVNKFRLLADLGVVTVPSDYVHATYLRSFRDRCVWNDEDERLWWRDKHRSTKPLRKEYFERTIKDKYFPNPSHILKPGERFRVQVFKQVIEELTPAREYLTFLTSQGAIPTGVQGACLLLEQKHKELPRTKDGGCTYICPDEEKRLWEKNVRKYDAVTCRTLPYIHVSDGVSLGLRSFYHPYNGKNTGVICFRPV